MSLAAVLIVVVLGGLPPARAPMAAIEVMYRPEPGTRP
jgi:hypothetical protein